jgi:hypothetical protein
MGPDVLGGAEFTELVAETLIEMAEIADFVPVGAVVGRRLNRFIWRSEASEVREQ